MPMRVHAARHPEPVRKGRPATIHECHRPCNVPLCPPRTRVHTTVMASARSSHHGTMSSDTGQLPMLRAVSVTRDDASSLTSSMSKA